MNLIGTAGYAGVVLLMAIESLFPPIPSEVIMPLAGYMATRGEFSLFWVVVAGTVGAVLGAMPLYYAGARLGEERLKEFTDSHGRWLTVSRRDVDRASRWFDRHGAAAVFFCRLVPGLRSLISLPAGIKGMGLGRFTFYTTAGSALWTSLLTVAGYALGASFQLVGEYLDPVSWVVFTLIVLFYVARVVRHKAH
jgi:membrane protein DedA with SNARE-associated domain